MTQSECEHQLEERFHDDLRKDLALIVVRSYKDAVANAKDQAMGPRFAPHSIPQNRHYLIQSRIEQELKGYDGVTVEIRRHNTGTEYYAVVKSENYHLLVSMVRSPGVLPRKTPFRTSNAQLNTLWSSLPGHDGNEEDTYTILTHVPSRDNLRPTHLELLVPNCNYTGSEFRFNWTHLTEFADGGVFVPSEEIETPVVKLKGSSKKSEQG